MSTTNVASSPSATIRVHIRVSSDSQNLDSQKHAAEKWLTAYGDGRPVAWYVEDGIMGDAKERPERDRLLAEAQTGDVVICFAIDRIGRDGIVGVLSVWKDFENRGIRLVSLCEPWADNSNPAAEIVIAVLAWAAQQEKKRLKERIRAGIAAKRARGEKWGGSKKGRRITVTWHKEQRAKKLLAAGNSIRTVAAAVKLGLATVHNIKKAVAAAATDELLPQTSG